MQSIQSNVPGQLNNQSSLHSDRPHIEVMPEIHGKAVVKIDPYQKQARLPKIILFIIIGLIVAGGIVYGSWYGYTNYLSKPKLATLIKKSAKEMSELKSYQVDLAMDIEMDSPVELTKAANLLAPLFGTGPEKVLRIQGSSQIDNFEPDNPRSQSKFDISLGGADFSFGVEAKTVDKKNYIQILDFPTELVAFMDTENLTNQWIDLSMDAGQEYLDEYKVFLDSWDANKMKDKVAEFKGVFGQPDLLEITKKCHNDTFEDDPVVSCQFKFKSEEVQELFREFLDIFISGPNLTDKTPSSDNQKKFKQFLDSMLVSIHYLKKSYLVKAIVVTSDSYQIADNFPISKLFFQIKFGEFNKIQKIDPPKESLKLKDFLGGILNQLKDMGQNSRDVKRISDIKQIQTAFELYFVDHNEYPSVDGKVILGKGDYSCLGQAGLNLADNCPRPYMAIIPSNPQPGGMDYIYSRISRDAYMIEFELEVGVDTLRVGKYLASQNGIQMKKVDQIDSDSDGLFDDEEESLGTDIREADTDDDRLTDFEEVRIYYTNPRNPDTDSDGYLDGQEVENGYNPLGEGRLAI